MFYFLQLGTYMVGSKLNTMFMGNGKMFMGPAKCMRHLRLAFGSLGGPLQNAYLALSNYGIISELESYYYSRYLFITRYYFIRQMQFCGYYLYDWLSSKIHTRIISTNMLGSQLIRY